jgi:LysM repeat protein
LIVFAILSLPLAACTRERPTEEPTATPTLPAEPVNATPSGADPAVEQATATPEGATAEASPSPAPSGAAQTYEYRVQQGETLLTIAVKFNTDVETIRKLNFLIDDNIFVGQILQVPFIEGITESGAPTATPEPFRYTVAAGDTLNSIGLRFDVSTVAIIEANGLLDPNSLVVGQEIIIPGYQPQAASGESASEEEATVEAPAAGETAGVLHVVQPGEGLLEIGRKYGVDANVIAEANNITNRNLLRVGQQLIIPGVTEQEAAQLRGTIHVVQAGESLLSIATRYGVTVAEILQINNIANADEIFVGQELIIPTD